MRAGSIPWATAAHASPVVSGAVQWTAVVNPGAGRRRRRAALARLGDALAARAVDIHVTPDAAETGLEVARKAFGRGEGVLACGGDGTVRDLAALASETDGLLAVVPMGAGNDFARALGYDHQHPLAALDVLDDGREVAVDLGRVAHRGRRGRVVHDRGPHRPRRRGEPVGQHRHVGVGHRALRDRRVAHDGDRDQPVPIRVTAERRRRGRAPPGSSPSATRTATAAACRSCPTARVDDGRLDAIIVDGAVSRAEVIRRFPQMIRGRHEGIEGVQPPFGRVRSRIDGPVDQDVWASGERVGLVARDDRRGSRRAARARARYSPLSSESSS